MCELMEIDVWEVIEAASTKPLLGSRPFFWARNRRTLHSARSVLPRLEEANA